MRLTALFPHWRGLHIMQVCAERDHLTLVAEMIARAARCPTCRRPSQSVHSRYQRRVADLPCAGRAVTLLIHARRFFCRAPDCSQQTFAERLTTLVAPGARRSHALDTALTQIGAALGGKPGARLARRLAMPTSDDTLLRLVRAMPLPVAAPAQVLGVDDWAWTKGRRYGTILCDLERHHALDLLPDRSADSVAAWLRASPGVRVIARDRSDLYADGATRGAPDARQVADRFHLLKNVTDGFEQFLIRHYALLRQAAREASTPDATAAPDLIGAVEATVNTSPPQNQEQRVQQERRARRYARYEEVRALHAEGHGIRAIARLTALNRRTVRRFLRAETFPERTPRAPRPQLITPFVPYLRERWEAGCHSATQLWCELRQQGFSGCYSIVAAHVRAWRGPTVATGRQSVGGARPQGSVILYSPRQTVWLLLRSTETLTAEERRYVLQLQAHAADVLVAQALVAEFAAVLREHDVAGLYAWLHRAEECGIADFRTLARGMWLDRAAVEAAVATMWSSGQVEGQVNRLKTLKRAMYGRANFDLLRQRMLYAG